jgi:Raf kinase inhibitor-like YbhB/YbcL family protein
MMTTALLASACHAAGKADAKKEGGKKMSITVTSTAFQNGQAIPAKFTGDGANVSPPLSLANVPPEAKALVLICDDPDAPAGTWVHWVLYDVIPTVTSLGENVARSEKLLGSAKQGVNDFKKLGYDGPAPPPGKPHRYFFKLYAVDRETELPARATKKQVLDAIKGHVVAEGELMGTYKR